MSNAALHDAPWDFTAQRVTHRFPPATYLRRDIADQERAHAERTLNAVNDSASVRVGLMGGLAVGLVTAIAVFSVGNELTGPTLLKLGVLGVVILAAAAALLGMVRRHTTAAAQLAERIRIYERRLAEIDTIRTARRETD